MASTLFQDYNQNTPIVASWLNDVNGVAYSPKGIKKVAANAAAAWVRFTVAAGVVTVQQSVNVLSVVRSGVGVYVVTYVSPMTNAGNCYNVTMNIAGFVVQGAETVNSVTIVATNTANTAFDPGSVSVVVYGAD